MMFLHKESFIGQLFYNAFRFMISVGFVTLFQVLFGIENTLLGVAIGVGFIYVANVSSGYKTDDNVLDYCFIIWWQLVCCTNSV